MTELFSSIPSLDPKFVKLLLLCGLGVGAFSLVVGVLGTVSGPSTTVRRMRGIAKEPPRQRMEIVSRSDTDPSGIFKAFIPTSAEERSKIAKKMRQAGIHRPGAVANYYIVRGILGVLFPLLLVGLVFLPNNPVLPFAADMNGKSVFQYVTVLVVLGFYGPAYWLNARIKERRKKIEQGLPNALDLLQVAIEAGLGFDAAMNRVAHELAKVVPPIAEEFMTVQLEIQAGMDREKAFLNLSERTGVEEMTAFANVVLQSAQFGSSISSALSTYAEEMRLTRELKAQEKANKLPVKMSGIMALFMMPTLLMITLAPVAIRWIRMFGEG